MLIKLLREFIKNNKIAIVKDNSENVLFVGDIHGDLSTAEKIKKIFKNYDKVVFLGDYVDRGNYGYEVLLELLNLWKKHKDKIVLLRGNHENLNMNYYYGFYKEILMKEKEVLNLIEEFYDSLSLIYVNEKLKVFAVHGGIGFVPKRLEELLDFEEDLLWSDFNWENPKETTFNYYRGCGKKFGLDILKQFMEKFRFKYFVRGHEYFKEGYRIFEFSGKRLITIFSSRANGYYFVNKKALNINLYGYSLIDL